MEMNIALPLKSREHSGMHVTPHGCLQLNERVHLRCLRLTAKLLLVCLLGSACGMRAWTQHRRWGPLQRALLRGKERLRTTASDSTAGIHYSKPQISGR